MPIGFRKSLLGFNCEDVMHYIESEQKHHAEAKIKHESEIEALNKKVNSLNTAVSSVTAERDTLAEQLREFEEKREEIERLSQNIGKLYLVAQSNAQAIIKNSLENSESSSAEVEKNLNTVCETHDTLEQLREEILEMSNLFSQKVDGLISSLNDTRSNIENRNTDTNQRRDQLSVVMNLLNE